MIEELEVHFDFLGYEETYRRDKAAIEFLRKRFPQLLSKEREAARKEGYEEGLECARDLLNKQK